MKVPITALEAQLEFDGNRKDVIVPPLPVRRRVSVEEFEADIFRARAAQRSATAEDTQEDA